MKVKSPAHKALLPRASSVASTEFLSHPAGGIARLLSKVKKDDPAASCGECSSGFNTEFTVLLKRRLLVPLILLAFPVAPLGYAALTGYLKVPDIPGESQRVNHEDEIEIHGIAWRVHVEPAEAGSGRTRSRADFSAITVQKYYDSSSPYLFLSTAQGKAFDEITLTFNRSNSDSGDFSYLEITLTNCVVTNYEVSGEVSSDNRIAEEVSFAYEEIKILYTVQADDHSSGDEHEVEYDVVADA